MRRYMNCVGKNAEGEIWTTVTSLVALVSLPDSTLQTVIHADTIVRRDKTRRYVNCVDKSAEGEI